MRPLSLWIASVDPGLESCGAAGRMDSQRTERSQDSRDDSWTGVRGGRGRVIVEIVCSRDFSRKKSGRRKNRVLIEGRAIYRIQMAVSLAHCI